MRLRDFSLAAKQSIGFGFVLIILIGANMYAVRQLDTVRGQLRSVTEDWLPRVSAINEINLNTAYLRAHQLQHALQEDLAQRKQRQVAVLIPLIDQIDANIVTFDSLRVDAQARQLYTAEQQNLHDTFFEKWEEYYTLTLEVFDLVDEDRLAAVARLYSEGQARFNDFSAYVGTLVAINEAASVEATRTAEQTYRSTRVVTLTLLIATILLSVVLTGALVRYLTVPIGRLAKATGQIAEGDLGVRVRVHGDDELGQLGRAFNKMTASLEDARTQTQQQADKLQQQQNTLQQKNTALEAAMHQLTEAQQQLVMREKMASLGNLVAGIAHEINNPINFVSANVKPLRRDLEDVLELVNAYEQRIHALGLTNEFAPVSALRDELDYNLLRDEIDDLLQGIEVGASRTAKIVKGLRNFSRLDEDDKKLADVNEGIESTLLILRNVLKNRIEVVKDLGVLPQLLCFPGKLNQVFLNILSNAAQAIDGEGMIYIRTEQVGEHLRLSFRDTGSGMTEAVKSRIFEPFFTTKDVGQGTGLGLSITFGIIRDHGGTIDVTSAPGEGTTFVLTLPLNG